jgi:hypothetical protein
MESEVKEAGNNIALNEENNDQKEVKNPSQTPQKFLRNAKKVNYAQFFSEDQDNSEEYETPEEIKQKIELSKRKRKRPVSVQKTSQDKNTTKKNKPKKEKVQKEKEKNDENNNNEEDNKDKKTELDKDKEKEEENAENPDKKTKNNSNQILNLTETLAKYNDTNENIPNSDIILILLEICLNSSQLGIEKDNSSRAFWDEIGKKPELKQITTKFKTETLRKYWRTIRETKKFKKIVSETKRYRNELNNSNMKLFASIHAICEYVSNPGRKMEYYLNKHMTKTSNKSNKINVNNMTSEEQIDDIVNTIKKYFPNNDQKEILEILFKNNFDIENTFLVLKDKENFENLGFTEKDDEIIKKNHEDKDDKNEEYQKLLYTKGLEGILRRKEFLFNIKIDRSQYKKNDDNLMVVEIVDKAKEKQNEKEENKEKDIKEEKEEKGNDNNQKMEEEK